MLHTVDARRNYIHLTWMIAYIDLKILLIDLYYLPKEIIIHTFK